MTWPPPLQTATRHGVRLYFDGTEEYHEILHLTQEEARNALRYHRDKAEENAGWRVTRAVLLTQRVDTYPWLEQVEEEEEAHGR